MSTSRRLTKKRTGTSSRTGNTVTKSAISQPTLLATDSALKITEYNATPIPRDSPSNDMSRDRAFINPGPPNKSQSTPMMLSSTQRRYSKDDLDIIYSTSSLSPQQRDTDSVSNTAEGLVDAANHNLHKSPSDSRINQIYITPLAHEDSRFPVIDNVSRAMSPFESILSQIQEMEKDNQGNSRAPQTLRSPSGGTISNGMIRGRTIPGRQGTWI